MFEVSTYKSLMSSINICIGLLSVMCCLVGREEVGRACSAERWLSTPSERLSLKTERLPHKQCSEGFVKTEGLMGDSNILKPLNSWNTTFDIITLIGYYGKCHTLAFPAIFSNWVISKQELIAHKYIETLWLRFRKVKLHYLIFVGQLGSKKHHTSWKHNI